MDELEISFWNFYKANLMRKGAITISSAEIITRLAGNNKTLSTTSFYYPVLLVNGS
jgi:hypothetical protein